MSQSQQASSEMETPLVGLENRALCGVEAEYFIERVAKA